MDPGTSHNYQLQPARSGRLLAAAWGLMAVIIVLPYLVGLGLPKEARKDTVPVSLGDSYEANSIPLTLNGQEVQCKPGDPLETLILTSYQCGNVAIDSLLTDNELATGRSTPDKALKRLARASSNGIASNKARFYEFGDAYVLTEPSRGYLAFLSERSDTDLLFVQLRGRFPDNLTYAQAIWEALYDEPAPAELEKIIELTQPPAPMFPHREFEEELL